jgi:hypothetical protein
MHRRGSVTLALLMLYTPVQLKHYKSDDETHGLCGNAAGKFRFTQDAMTLTNIRTGNWTTIILDVSK